jgi:DNA-binding MarR family transcriptional regulator
VSSRGARTLIALFADFHLVDQAIRVELDRLGIRTYWLAVLHIVRDHRAMTPTELAAASGVPPSTLRHVVNRLVELGHVRREPNPEDGRSQLLSLTREGAQLARAADAALEAAVAGMDEGLGWHVEELERPLEELRAALQRGLGLTGASQPALNRR